MNTKALKQKILDLAIHGKLVPQNPDDEPASKLLERIREEKKLKIENGELKADKNDSYIFVGDDKRRYEKMPDGTVKDIEDEIPFDVPEGWAWCRLKEVCTVLMGQSPEGSSVSGNSNGMEFHQGKIYFTDKYLAKAENYTSDITRVAPANSILLCVRAPVGVVNITNREICIGRGLCAIRPKYEISENFWFYWLQYLKEDFEQKATGTTFKAISVEVVKQQFIPIPTLNEQKNIVSAIENIFAQIDTLEQNKSDLQTAIKHAKSKILDLAIHGKLVPQDSSDEPASVLLEKLRAEKESKIKAGELKRDKNDSYIYKSSTDNCHCEKFADGTVRKIDIPFDLPDSWSWCNGYELFNPMKSRKPSGLVFKYIDIETIDNKKHRVIRPKELSVSEAPSRASREVANGDVLFSLVRPYLENIALITEENQDCIASTGFFVCKPKKVLDSKFLFFLMTTSYVVQGLNEFMKGDNSPSINGDDILRWLYPLPPLSEQKRIVEKIENAFAKLDFIAEQLA